MMDDQKRSMNTFDSDHGAPVDPDEAIVRAALAAHPWPRFGEALQGRLLAIATTAVEASPEAAHDARRSIADEAAPPVAPPVAPRGVRGWRREGWASAVVLATVAVLAIALAGTARLRQARPAEGPNAESPTPVATDAAISPDEGITNTNGLTGRLIYFVPGEGDGNATVFALDMRTGRSERLWEAPGSDDRAKWAIAPDGTRLAYARQPSGENPGLLYVRHLDAAAPEPQAMTSLDADEYTESGGRFAGYDRLVWSPDSTMLYFGVVHVAEAFPGAMPHFVRWELHRLTLDDSRLASQMTPTVGPLSWGVNAGEDRVLARIEPDDLPQGNVADLLAVDAVNHRAAVAIGPGESQQVNAIALIDTDSGLEVRRLPIGNTEGFDVAAIADGARLAYTEYSAASEANLAKRIQQLTLANAEESPREVWGPTEQHLTPARLASSNDAWWLAWDAWDGDGNVRGMIAAMDPLGGERREVGHVLSLDSTFVAFSPDGDRLLTATGAVIDLEAVPAVAGDPLPQATLPWPAPEGMAWDDAPRRVLGWIADVDRAAGTAAETPVPAAEATELTPIATVAVPPDPADVTVGPLLDIEDWSPDGRWLPFWTAERYDYTDPRREAAQLHFYDTTTGTVCTQPGAKRATRTDSVFWERHGEVTVRIDGVPAIGRPCEALTGAPGSEHAFPTAQPGETPEWAVVQAGDGPVDSKGDVSTGLSLDKQFTATTTALDDEANYETVITRNSDGQRVAATTWQGRGGFGGAGLGGQWLPNGDFIISEAMDRGPLVIRPSGDVEPLAARHFGIDELPSEPWNVHMNVHIDPDGSSWHLLLTGMGAVRLYHSETESAEALPSDELWDSGVSRDGRWLMIMGRDGEGGSSEGLWIRGLDDTSEPFRQIPWSEEVGGNSAPYSSDATQYAFGNGDGRTVAVVTFPDGEVLGRWDLVGYEYSGTRWSPDGRWIAIEGYRSNADGAVVARALYIAPLPAEP